MSHGGTPLHVESSALVKTVGLEPHRRLPKSECPLHNPVLLTPGPFMPPCAVEGCQRITCSTLHPLRGLVKSPVSTVSLVLYVQRRVVFVPQESRDPSHAGDHARVPERGGRVHPYSQDRPGHSH
jgi:hypothetical protein